MAKMSKKQKAMIAAWIISTPAGQKTAKVLGFIILIGLVIFGMAASCSS